MATAAQQQEEHRINFRIDVREVRLIDAQGNMIGVVSTRDALASMHYVYPTLAGSVFDAMWD